VPLPEISPSSQVSAGCELMKPRSGAWNDLRTGRKPAAETVALNNNAMMTTIRWFIAICLLLKKWSRSQDNSMSSLQLKVQIKPTG
jgi:hypothetical protein